MRASCPSRRRGRPTRLIVSCRPTGGDRPSRSGHTAHATDHHTVHTLITMHTGPQRSERVHGTRRAWPDSRDIWTLGIACVVTAVLGAVASAPPASWEITVFRSINDLSHELELLTWPVQQLGMAVAIPIGAVVLWWLIRSWRKPAILLIAAGALGWGLANMVRGLVGRVRPASLLDQVQLGYDVPGMGHAFPSGHTIVVMTLVIVFAPHVPRAIIIALVGVLVVVGVARIYVGAHMPLDVLAGASFGAGVGALVNLGWAWLSEREEVST